MDIQKSSSKVFFSKAGGAALSFTGIAIFARVLGSASLGTFFLFQALLGIAALPANMGINPAVAKRVSEGQSPGRVLTTAFLMKTVPVSLIVVLIIAFRSHVNGYLGTPAAHYLIAGIVLQELSLVVMRTLDGELRVGETAIIKFVNQTFWILGGGVFVALGYGVEGLIGGLLIGKALGAVIGLSRTTAQLSRPTWTTARSLFDFSKYSFVGLAGGYVYNWMDIVIIGAFIGQSAVGAYEVAWRVTAVTIMFSNSIGSAITPQISQWSSRDALDQVEALITEVVTPSMFFVIPAFAGTVLLADEILTFGFGPEYAAASSVLVILMGDKVAKGIDVILGTSLASIDRPDLAAVASLVSVLVNLILNLVLVWQFGIVGAAVATVIASLTNDALHAWALSRFVSIDLPWRELGWCVLAATVMGIVLFGAVRIFPVTSLPRLLVVISLGGIVYLVTALSSSTIRRKVVKYVPSDSSIS